LKARDAKLQEFAKAKPELETVILGDTLQKMAYRNLALTIKFRLTPIGYGLCSHLKAILCFDGQHLKTFYTSVPGTMKNLRKELTVEVFTKFGQINAGPHRMKIEMSGQLPSGRTLGHVSSKEFTITVPRLEELERPTTKQIIIERIEGESGVSIVTSHIKRLYKQMEEHRKRELEALRQGS
jgi:hypothetical protein